MNVSIADCRTVNLPQIQSRAGNITPVEGSLCVPFKIKRVFYIYDIPGGKDRGAHAHKECHQFLVAASGSFEVEIDDGLARKTVVLNQPYIGLHVPPGLWSAEKNFSSGAVCLVLVSHLYAAEDYIRDYGAFLAYKGISP
jgi:hypothetical protein